MSDECGVFSDRVEMERQGEIIAVCTSANKGERKIDVGSGLLVEGFGLAGDAHGGDLPANGLAGAGERDSYGARNQLSGRLHGEHCERYVSNPDSQSGPWVSGRNVDGLR